MSYVFNFVILSYSRNSQKFDAHKQDSKNPVFIKSTTQWVSLQFWVYCQFCLDRHCWMPCDKYWMEKL